MNRTGCTVSTGSLPDPCGGVVKSVAIEATCSGSPGGAQVCRGGLAEISQGWDSLLQESSHPCLFCFVLQWLAPLLCVRPFARQLSIVNSCATNGGVCPLPAAPWQTTWQLNRSTICQVHSCAFSYLPCLPRHPVPLCGRGGTACVALHSPACMCWHGLCCAVMCCDVQPGNTKGFLNATEAARWG